LTIPQIIRSLLHSGAAPWSYRWGLVGKFPGKGGDYHGYIRNPKSKAETRRRWKRVARAEGKLACKEADD